MWGSVYAQPASFMPSAQSATKQPREASGEERCESKYAEFGCVGENQFYLAIVRPRILRAFKAHVTSLTCKKLNRSASISAIARRHFCIECWIWTP